MTAAPTRQVPEAPPVERRSPGRAARRTSQRMHRRRRLVALAVIAVVALSGLATGVGRRLVSDGLGLLPSTGGGGGPAPASLLLVLATDTPLPSLVLLGHSGDARSALLVPSATQVEVPSLGSETLARALGVDGPDAAGLALSNALGVRVDDVLALDAAATEDLLAAAGPLEVRFREPVRVGDRGFGAGAQRLSPSEVASVLAVPGEDELTRLVLVHALVEGWLAALDRDEVAALPAPARKVVSRLAGEAVRFDLLPVEGLGLADERYQIDRARAGATARGLFPRLLYDGGPDGRVRVEIRNGTGKVGLAGEVASRVVPAGAEVVLTGNAARFSVTETVLVIHDPDRRADAERLAEALGVGQLRLANDPVSVVDVSIVVGSDYRPGGG